MLGAPAHHGAAGGLRGGGALFETTLCVDRAEQAGDDARRPHTRRLSVREDGLGVFDGCKVHDDVGFIGKRAVEAVAPEGVEVGRVARG